MIAQRASHDPSLHASELSNRCRSARDAAVARLMDCVENGGGWFTAIDFGGLVNATYIIMLRTSGLICSDDVAAVEVSVLRHLKQQINTDGGFMKFRNAPSSRGVTRIALVAIRLALGEVDSGGRPAEWFAKNPHIDQAIEIELRSLLTGAERFLEKHVSDESHRKWETDVALLANLLVAHADRTSRMPKAKWLHPWLTVRFARASPTTPRCLGRPGAFSLRQFNYLLRKSLPAFSILQERSRHRGAAQRGAWLLRWLPGQTGELVDRIRADQNPDGSWLFNSLNTMVNVMALRAAGVPRDDAAIERAHERLLKCIVSDGPGGSFVNALFPDVWNTSHALRSFLLVNGSGADDKEVRESVAFLLRCQGTHGGFGWAQDSAHDAENDSTGFALRTLALAAKSADAGLRTHIQRSIHSATEFLLDHQAADGGFGAWGGSRFGCGRNAPSVLEQLLFDIPAIDTTARIAEGLVEGGLAVDHPAIKSVLRFLLRNQCDSGAWWSRWWAGYLVGTAQVLRTYGRCGLTYARTVTRANSLLLQHSTEALERGVEFVLSHQNRDGGWGETIRADTDLRYAGIGASTPLHTAFVISALIACGYPATTSAVRRGIECLLNMMKTEGVWQYRDATFTLHAGSLYFSYEFLNRILPLDALTDYLNAIEGEPKRLGDLETASTFERQRDDARASRNISESRDEVVNPRGVCVKSDVCTGTAALRCHPRAQTQWWHYIGHLRSRHRSFGFQLTLFRRRTDGVNRHGIPFTWPNSPLLYFGHFAFTDLDCGQFRHAHRRATNKGSASNNGYRVQLGDWSVREKDGKQILAAKMRGVSLQLELEATKRGVPNGGHGEFHRTSDQLATHISFTRMAAQGILSLDGQPHCVMGSAWLDREFGTCNFSSRMGGWDWFAIQLDDGREIMLYQVCDERRQYNGHRSLSVVDLQGKLSQLRRDDFRLRVQHTWRSPWTQTVYPSGWLLDAPSLNMRLHIKPLLPCQELDTRGSTNVIYWEGVADAHGQIENNVVKGHAYAELVGYHRKDRLILQKPTRWWTLIKNEVHYWRFAAGKTVDKSECSP